jgi:hypothetical protein
LLIERLCRSSGSQRNPAALGTAQAMPNLAINTDAGAPSATDAGAALR